MPDKKRILMQNMHHPIYMQEIEIENNKGSCK